MPKITLLCGGIGGSKLALGLYHVLPSEQFTIIGNIGDDMDIFGLHICPDLDTIVYTLAGLSNPEQGWGLKDEQFNALRQVTKLGAPSWFQLGDNDLGLHLARTHWLQQGARLSWITNHIANQLGVRCTILPASEQSVPTMLYAKGTCADKGWINLQSYMVEHQCLLSISQIQYSGAELAKPTRGIKEALMDSDLVIFAPSNPLLSIQPILAVGDIQDCLKKTSAYKVAISPIVEGNALKGPTRQLMEQLGFTPSPVTIATWYQELIDGFVIDPVDSNLASDITNLGLACHTLPIVMSNLEHKTALAKTLCELIK